MKGFLYHILDFVSRSISYKKNIALILFSWNWSQQEGWHDDRPRSFLIYAPSRTAVVYALVKDESEPIDVDVGTSISSATSAV